MTTKPSIDSKGEEEMKFKLPKGREKEFTEMMMQVREKMQKMEAWEKSIRAKYKAELIRSLPEKKDESHGLISRNAGYNQAIQDIIAILKEGKDGA